MLLLSLLVSSFATGSTNAAEPESATDFKSIVVPFLEMHCNGCHGDEEPEAKLSLSRFRESANIQTEYETWQKVLLMLNERRMPPEDEPRPSAEEYSIAIQGVEAELARFDCTAERHPGRVTIRRLNRVAYNNTIRDLVGIDFQPAKDFPADDVGNGFDNMGDVLTLPPLLFEKYLSAAETIVSLAWEDPESRRRILVHEPEGDDNVSDAARKNLAGFATRAFRRPAADDEVERLAKLMQEARDQRLTEAEAYQTALQAILVSPYFLFRVELDPEANDADGIRELNDYEIASRLSYFLWSSMPDEELFQLAAQKTLRDEGVLQSQVERMLRDEKACSLVKDFAGQWLQLRDIPRMTPDTRQFPAFDEELRMSMLRETELFLETMIREDRSVLEFLDADFSYVNERLARHYGIEGIAGEEFRRVSLPNNRRGILTQGSILLLTSNPTRTSPVKRGKWILDNILGEPPPPPPPNVPTLEEAEALVGSLREKMQQHRLNPSCAVCHEKMDTLGFGFENFDAIGGWRELDGRFPINAAGTLPGVGDFDGPRELAVILKEKKRDDFCRCLISKMLAYALGRGLDAHDHCVINNILTRLSENDYRFSELVLGIVQSDPFLSRETQGERS